MPRITRRAAMAGSTALPLWQTATVRGSQANSSVSLGIIGVGVRGRYVGTHMARDGRARVTALCDLFEDRIEQGKKLIPGTESAKAYQDYRQLLDNTTIDAVLIATPVCLHPEMFEAAVSAGKHIYCEKPAAMDVAGVRRVEAAGRKADPAKVVQFGFQQRFSPEYRNAHQLVAEGRLGELKMMMSFWILGMAPRLTAPSALPYPEPSELDRRIRLWTKWRELSGGDIVECDCHGLDTLNWFAASQPQRALGQGGLRYPVFYGNVTSDRYDIIFTYPNGAEAMLISARSACGFRDVREQFYGSKGVLETARTYYKVHGPVAAARLANDDQLEDASLMEKFTSKREITIDAVEAFFTAIAERQPRNMARDAATSTLTSILGRMAYEERREVTWTEMMKTG